MAPCAAWSDKAAIQLIMLNMQSGTTILCFSLWLPSECLLLAGVLHKDYVCLTLRLQQGM